MYYLKCFCCYGRRLPLATIDSMRLRIQYNFGQLISQTEILAYSINKCHFNDIRYKCKRGRYYAAISNTLSCTLWVHWKDEVLQNPRQLMSLFQIYRREDNLSCDTVQRRPSPRQWCISPCFRFPPISEKFSDSVENFPNFLVNDHKFGFSLYFRCFPLLF